MTADDKAGPTPLPCILGLHSWRSVGLMNIYRQYALRCSRCGRAEVRQG